MENVVIYEITVQVEPELTEKYEDYMCRHHIPDLLATGYFRGADFSQSSRGRYRVRYEAFDQKALDKYLETEADHLRTDFGNHFPAGVQLSREIWTVVQFWRES